MLIKIFGLLDLLAATSMLLIHFNVISWHLGFGLATYLIIKSLVFRGDFASLLDLLSGVYFIMVLFGIKTLMVYVVLIYLVQKSFLSLK
ncbi:hypothetical protein GOV05_02835 [Candidatus Woesearchaeota archaeon]|nr:hypothetical protein [Candidatus Woesearchaeota archaeon]